MSEYYRKPIVKILMLKGKDGDGKGISSISKTGTSGLVDTYTITLTDGTTSTFTVTNGEKGVKGDTGPQGPQGVKGQDGQSIKEIKKTSTSGLIDTYEISLTDGTKKSFTVTNGKGIISITKTETSGLVDTYTIEFNDGTTSTFTVTNGDSSYKPAVEALGKRIDNLILSSGTESSAEVIDARNGYDGTTYDTLGTAIRTQVSKLKSDLEQMKQNGTGLSTEAIDKLEEVGNYLAYTTADGGSKWTELISILRNGSSGGGSGETEVTLSSISATYTGGEVTTGTALSDLTGITVIATYSDGTTKTVTGYTLSGEILEGENIITVSYGGKTTTFTVTGIVESGGEVTAELPTDGLVAYFDFRNTTPEINTQQGLTKFNANKGNGCLFTWIASAFTSSDDYGVKRMARSYQFDKNGGTNPSELGTSFTMLFKGYNVVNGAFVSNDHTGVSNTSVFLSKPKYNTSSGQLQVGQENIGNKQLSGYIDAYFVADGEVFKVYINGELVKTYTGTDYEDFVSWYSKVTTAVFGDGNYQTALALYGKALSEVEIAEARAFLQTLEVA